MRTFESGIDYDAMERFTEVDFGPFHRIAHSSCLNVMRVAGSLLAHVRWHMHISWHNSLEGYNSNAGHQRGYRSDIAWIHLFFPVHLVTMGTGRCRFGVR